MTNLLQTETRIREIWPSVARIPAVSGLGKMLIKSIVLAPLGWMVMAGAYFGKVLPFVGVRYKLTDKRVMIMRGWSQSPSKEVALTEIDDVVIDPGSLDLFFRSGDLKMMHGGNVVLTLSGVPDPEAFRRSIIDARNAWAPGKVKTLPFISATVAK